MPGQSGRVRAQVAVVGPGEATPEQEAAAAVVGRGLARLGAVVVTGGLGGVMEAASRGAADAGGLVLGLLPGDDADAANPWVHVRVPTGLGEARDALVVAAADVVVVVGGSWGTLAEVALAARRRRPVVLVAAPGLDPWRVRRERGEVPGPVEVGSAEAAVARVAALLGDGSTAGPPGRDRRTAPDPARSSVSSTDTDRPAAASGTFSLGGDLPVVRLGYGAMRITGRGIWGSPSDPETCRRVLRRAVELGVTLIDTADSYGPDVSEELIAEALHPYPDDLVIATKAGLLRTGPDKWHPLGRPEYIRQQCEMSLRKLRVERIDLFQLHRIDPRVPADEQFGALRELRDEGKVRHVGLSEVDVDEIRAAQDVVPVVSVQNRYNLVDRGSEDVLRYCEEQGIGFIPWFPVAAGDLARPGGPLDRISLEHGGATVAQLALAWLLRRSPVMLPIPGTSSVEHLEENVAAAGLELGDDEYEELSSAAA